MSAPYKLATQYPDEQEIECRIIATFLDGTTEALDGKLAYARSYVIEPKSAYLHCPRFNELRAHIVHLDITETTTNTYTIDF